MIYIGIPARDEAATAGILLWKIRKVMAELGRDYEILLLDDASDDGTAEAVERYRRALPVRVRRHEARRGYAASMEALARAAVAESAYPKRDVLVLLQADFSDDPAQIVPLVKRIEGGADVVIAGARNGPRGLAWARRFCVWARARLSLPPGIGDPLSGFRAYRIFVLKRALDTAAREPLLRTEGRASNVELLAWVAPFARRVDEEPAALRRDRLQRPARFRGGRLWRDLLRLYLRPVRFEGTPAPAPSRWRTHPRARGGGSRKRRRVG